MPELREPDGTVEVVESGATDKAVEPGATDESRDALAVWGRATFLRAGIATVVASTRAIVVHGVPTCGSTCVLALLQVDRPAGISVQAVSAASGAITIWLTGLVTEDTPVAWWAFELTPR